MMIDGRAYRTIWLNDDRWSVEVIDQRRFPHRFETLRLTSCAQAADAIGTMAVRGAPLIGATAAYGLALAAREDAGDANLLAARESLLATRPTAVNLRWALDEMMAAIMPASAAARRHLAYDRAAAICEQDVAINRAIGHQGVRLIERAATRKAAGEPLNILTHCNAGWLATVDWGTATAPIYMAHDAGIAVHVWVDETRPRNQGAYLTAWELGRHGVPHTVITDNAGGHLMQRGLVDLCLVGTDRVTATGDVCNKIGTYLKALAAFDNKVPFYVATPSPTIDFAIEDGTTIPIETRSPDEVSKLTGLAANGRIETIDILPEGSNAANYAFDVTPAKYVTALITERGVVSANAQAIAAAFPDRAGERPKRAPQEVAASATAD